MIVTELSVAISNLYPNCSTQPFITSLTNGKPSSQVAHVATFRGMSLRHWPSGGFGSAPLAHPWASTVCLGRSLPFTSDRTN